MSETRILCEGYHDRAFWDGWLTYLGCSNEGFKPGTKGHPAVDPWGRTVTGGHFAYHSKNGGFIRVAQCGGKTNILRQAKERLDQRVTKAIPRLILNVDPDAPATGAAATGLRVQDVLHFAQTSIDPAAKLNADGEIEIDQGASIISLVRWEASDPAAPGLPDQQTLERLVCAAIAAVYPARAQAVQDWLDGRPSPPPANPKDHSWSYMAGWHSDAGCEFFYTHLWKDPAIVGELKVRLTASGAWRLAQRIAS